MANAGAPVGPGGMPPAPSNRDGELLRGNQTVFEFTGNAADDPRASSKHTFVGSANIDLGSVREKRESNLRSGATGWIFIGMAVLATAGLTAFFVLTPKSGSASDATDEAAVADEASAREAEETKSEETKPEQTKAGDDETKDQPAPPAADTPKDEPAKTDPAPKASSGGTKKTSTTKPSNPKPSSGGSKKTLTPKKPPRDPLADLPAPP